jgi:uncharacterized protein (DUF111 family)
MLSVLCDEAKEREMERILFLETSTIGLRRYKAERTCLPRRAVTISTPYGEVKAKEVCYEGRTRITPEYEDARRLAKEKNVPLQKIYSRG